MRDPYEILGLSENATDEQIREAYRVLARRAQEENGDGANAAKKADDRMRELDWAYDQIIMSRSTGYSGYSGAGQSYAPPNQQRAGDFSDIRIKIREGRFDDAEMLLDGVPVPSRTAEWFFLKGSIQHRKGWLEEASGNFSAACRLDPQNREYRAAYDNISRSRSGGYRTEDPRSEKRQKSGCSGCDVCGGLVCADCCCECMGGDLIKCC